MLSVLLYGSLITMVILVITHIVRYRRIARMQADHACFYCGGGYKQWQDPHGQLCPHCGKSVIIYIPSQQIDTDRYSYRTPTQRAMLSWETCGCPGVPLIAPSVNYPKMMACAECIEDEATFTKIPQR